MAWPGADPLAFFRGLIDEVDDAARRPAGPAGRPDPRRPAAQGRPATRDPDREREIAERDWPLRAPELGADRLARIVHAIITECLGRRAASVGRHVVRRAVAARTVGARLPPSRQRLA